MITKWLKIGVIGTAGFCLLGGLFFGKDLASYVRSSARGMRTVVKGSVPIEFELRRARDLLEDIIPEMRANIQLIAQEEVEVAALKAELARGEESLGEERERVQTLRASLQRHQASYRFGGREYSHTDVKADLAGRFERLREGELVLASKARLLVSRENSLNAAMQLLEKTRGEKRILENKIEALASQHRLVKAAAVGSKIHVDNSKLAQTEKLIAQIQKRLNVAERVLAHESRFVESIPVDSIVEEDLVAQVDEYFETRNSEESGENAALVAIATGEEATSSVTPGQCRSRAVLILRIRQAECALADGRLDEAFEIAQSEDIRRHRHGQRLIGQLTRALIRRGQENLTAGQFQPALTDCNKAEKLAGNTSEIAKLRAAVCSEILKTRQGHEQEAFRVAQARQQVDDGWLSVGERILDEAPSAHEQAGRLRQELAAVRLQTEDAVAKARQALKQGDIEQAIDLARTAQVARNKNGQVAELRRQIGRRVLEHVRTHIEQGRIDRAQSLMQRLAPRAVAGCLAGRSEAGRRGARRAGRGASGVEHCRCGGRSGTLERGAERRCCGFGA